MSEYHIPTPGSANEGDIILFVRRHWASFMGQFLLSFLMLVMPAVVILSLYFSDLNIIKGLVINFIVLGLSIYYLIAITVAFVAWISFYYDIYIVCKDSITDIVQEGFWGRKISQVSLLRVQDVSSNIQGFLPTIFGYGDVLVETAGEQTQNFLLKAIPNPQEVSAKILQLHHDIVAKEQREQETKEGEGVLKPTGQELLSQEKTSNEVSPKAEKPSSLKQGEISPSDLERGGEIDLK